MTFRLVVFLVLTMVGTMEAQTVTKAKPISLQDPGIPGVRLIHSSDPEFAKLPEASIFKGHDSEGLYAIKNETKQRIVAFSVGIDNDTDPELVSISPLQVGLKGVEPGESAMVWPLGMWTRGDGYLIGSDVSKKTFEFFINYVVLEDGSFYGYQEDYDQAAAGLEWRKGFVKAALAAPNLDEFMQKQQTELWGREMGAKSSAASRGISDAYQFMGGLFALDHDAYVKDPAKGRQFIEQHLSITHRNGLKRIKLPSFEPKPEAAPKNALDGWRFEGYFSQCWNQGGLFPSGPSIGGMDSPTCTFPANAAAATVTNPDYLANYGLTVKYYDPPLAWSFSASCIQAPPNTYAGANDSIPRRYLSDGENYHVPSTAQQNLEPANRLYYQVTTNANASLGWQDTVYVKRILGILQPYNPEIDAIDPGGSTICQERYLDPDTYLELKAKGIPIDAMPFVKADYLTVDNTAQSDYGYIVINTATVYACGGVTQGRSKSLKTRANYYFSTGRPSVKYGYSSSGAPWINYTHCDHFPATAAGGGGKLCSIQEDCCCCWNTFHDTVQCNIVCGGFFPDSSTCSAPAGVSPSSALPVTSAMDPSAGNTSAQLPPILNYKADRIGFFRASGPVWWEDAFASHVTDQTAATVYFAPPGGLQSGDVPVAGDWAGIGVSSPGFFRPSTGEWFLDANGDNVWGSGDLHYQFGQAGDVPVVGDWQGHGQTCIGVFRYGFYWIIDADCNGYWSGNGFAQDSAFAFGGAPGDIPVVGTWYGQAGPASSPTPHTQAQVGVIRCYSAPGANGCTSPNFLWVLDNDAAIDPDQGRHGVGLGLGCGINPPYDVYYGLCLTPAPFAFGGLAGDQFIPGNWWGTGTSNAAIYRPSNGLWVLDNGTDPNHNATTVYAFGGLPGDIAVKGKW